jgi:DTW domain-containing protein YfiP
MKQSMTRPSTRAVCLRCRRPEVVCYCAHLPSLPTRTRVLLLQHIRERRVGIGTARMAHLALPSSVLRVGIDFSDDPVVAEMLADRTPSYLLFPSDDARDVRELAGEAPITLVVVDGTWSQARTLVRVNPKLAALPRIAFTPRRPSEYRIRREPADHCVSTIEALAEVLNILEPQQSPFDPLLNPFRVMVDRQARFAVEVQESRHARRHPRVRPAPATLASRLTADWSRLVCIYGEGNAWPVREASPHEPELVHFVASRPATGELYEALIAPRRPLAPATPHHVGLPAPQLLAGGTVEAWRQSWQAFARPDDILVQWGSFYTNLATADGLTLPSRRIDLRGELTQLARLHGESLEACAHRLGGPVPPPALPGRGGSRLTALQHLLHACRTPDTNR